MLLATHTRLFDSSCPCNFVGPTLVKVSCPDWTKGIFCRFVLGCSSPDSATGGKSLLFGARNSAHLSSFVGGCGGGFLNPFQPLAVCRPENAHIPFYVRDRGPVSSGHSELETRSDFQLPLGATRNEFQIYPNCVRTINCRHSSIQNFS